MKIRKTIEVNLKIYGREIKILTRMNFGFMRMNLNILTKRNGMKFISLFHCCNLQIHPQPVWGLLLSLVQTRLKGPLDQQKLGPKGFGPMGPLYFYVFNRVKTIINWVPPWGSDLGFTAVKMSLGFLFSLFKF